MICSILKFLSIDQSPIIGELSGPTSDSVFFKTLLLCAVSAEPAVRQQAAEVIERLHAELPTLLIEFDSREEIDMLALRRGVWNRRYRPKSATLCQYSADRTWAAQTSCSILASAL